MEKIPIIINPYSRKNIILKGNASERFRRIGGDFIDIYVVKDLQELDRLAEDCSNREIEYLAVSGGDGTIHQVLSRFINIYGSKPIPPLLILKDGTMNNISNTVRLRGSGYDILKRFVKSLKQDKEIICHARNTMKIGDKYCFLFGTGLTTNILNAVYEGDDKDIPKVIRIIIQAFSDGLINPGGSSFFKRFKARVYLNDEEVGCTDLLGILAGTVEDIGMGLRPLSRLESGERTFHVIATGMTPREMAMNIISLSTRKHIEHPLHYDSHVKKMKLVSDKPFQYTMDGDLYFAEEELLVEIGSEVRLISV